MSARKTRQLDSLRERVLALPIKRNGLRDVPEQLWDELVRARVCPECARYGLVLPLVHRAADENSNGGWGCKEDGCEYFEPDRIQERMLLDDDAGRRDADPGL